jgi:hypothetical protein
LSPRRATASVAVTSAVAENFCCDDLALGCRANPRRAANTMVDIFVTIYQRKLKYVRAKAEITEVRRETAPLTSPRVSDAWNHPGIHAFVGQCI